MKNSNYLKKWIIYSLAFSGIIIAISTLALVILPINSFCSDLIETARERGFSEDNIYATEISATFIIVSLVSFLSRNGESVLWENTVRYSLVSPKIINFISITVFLIIDLIGATISFWMNNAVVFFVLFILDLLLLIIMTYKMIGAFFARESIKRKLISDYEKMDDKDKEDVIAEIYDKTISYINENQLKIAEENMDFLYKYEKISTLELLLDFLSKKNGNQFWMIVKKYSLYENVEICKSAKNLCLSLINKRQNPDLLRELIGLLFSQKKMKNAIAEFESFVSTEIKANDLFNHVQSREDEDRRNLIKELRPIVEENNKRMADYVAQNIDLPIDLLIMAITENDITSFRVILDYISDFKKNFETAIICATLKMKIDDERCNSDKDYSLSETGYEIKNALSELISVEIIPENEKEFIRNIVVHKNRYLLLSNSDIDTLENVVLKDASIK